MTNETTPYEQLRNVVAATDYSNRSLLALDAAIEDVYRHHGFLHVVHVANSAEELAQVYSETQHAELLEKLRRYVAPQLMAHAELHALPAPMNAICHIRTGDAAREIVQAASDLEADVIYLSTHGPTGVRRAVLGSIAETVVRHARSPVMVMRPTSKSQDGWADATEEKDDEDELVIDPPCPKCLAIRRQTGGRVFWCDTHQANLGRRHTYHQVPRAVRQRINMPLVFPQDDIR